MNSNLNFATKKKYQHRPQIGMEMYPPFHPYTWSKSPYS